MPDTDSLRREQIRTGRRVTWVGLWSNLALSVSKILAGIFGRSAAMIADGVHSASDLLTDVMVLAVIGISRREEDDRHSYGYGKVETFATFIIAVLLGIVAIGICLDGARGIANACRGIYPPRPGWIALAMAIVSICVKEMLFRYTRSAARRISSAAMEANAWHHRSDAFSSVATVIGVGGAMFLGERWRVLDPVAAIFVSLLILAMAWKLASASAKELLEVALPKDVTDKAASIISATPGVEHFHRLRTRRNGNRMIFDMHVKVDPELTVRESHEIASEIERRIRDEFVNVLVNVHIEPWNPPSP